MGALEETGFILAEGARWLVGEEERKRREGMGRVSSTVVAFVRSVAEADVLLKKDLWLGVDGTQARLRGMKQCSL